MNVTSDPATPRPLQWLRGYSEEFPGVWKLAKKMRSERGEELPYWPEWCYLPVSGGFAIASAYTNDLPEQARQASIFSALAAWRMTKGIYRFDSDILDAVWETPAGEGKIPTDVLFRLPEWCCYIETPGKTLPVGPEGEEQAVGGFFVYLEHDMPSAEQGVQRRELRFVLDLGSEGDEEGALLYPIPLHLTRPTLAECLEETARTSSEHAMETYGEDLFPAGSLTPLLGAMIPPLLSMTLYLCSAAEIRAKAGDPEARPGNPEPQRIKKKEALFAAKEPTTWEVAYRLGAALRAALRSEATGAGGTGPARRGHIRRAHWHAYWTGPRAIPEERKLILKWLPPIPVSLDDVEELPATVRRVD